ncbi:hypothetical protein pdul_cds_1060 [Pandoravirus dulcis]|uniref:Uncharacterized protein n=1 Tax=Pandoravirus dulcis TaxID=1349409 RepID=A0A291AU80_9VIRU|nr:hypothetical protein pdul_cds_1060 [Pandoravirus dulcis]ATE82581.1 hypothetical protein pdul_cds_1060 [Pandoravirus dulcis]
MGTRQRGDGRATCRRRRLCRRGRGNDQVVGGSTDRPQASFRLVVVIAIITATTVTVLVVVAVAFEDEATASMATGATGDRQRKGEGANQGAAKRREEKIFRGF